MFSQKCVSAIDNGGRIEMATTATGGLPTT